MASRLSTEARGELREYTTKEIVLATDNFSWPLRSESVGIWGRVYKGYIGSGVVSVKFLTSSEKLQFESMVRSSYIGCSAIYTPRSHDIYRLLIIGLVSCDHQSLL